MQLWHWSHLQDSDQYYPILVQTKLCYHICYVDHLTSVRVFRSFVLWVALLRARGVDILRRPASLMIFWRRFCAQLTGDSLLSCHLCRWSRGIPLYDNNLLFVTVLTEVHAAHILRVKPFKFLIVSEDNRRNNRTQFIKRGVWKERRLVAKYSTLQVNFCICGINLMQPCWMGF